MKGKMRARKGRCDYGIYLYGAAFGVPASLCGVIFK